MRCKILILAFTASCLMFSCSKEVAQEQTLPIKFATFTEPREHGTKDLFIYSPWEPEQYALLGFPEHCWGENLPNTSHNSSPPVLSPWQFNADSTVAEYEHSPREGVLFRARAVVDSMAVKLFLEIENNTDIPIKNIRTLICLKPDASRGLPSRSDGMLAFRDTSYQMTWFPVERKPVQLHEETHYHGDYPDRGWTDIRSKINWGVNLKGGLDNRTLPTIGWFRGNSPGRIVQEEADPALIAVHSRQDENRWIATIWNPARILFCNPQNPCFHSDPQLPDCPVGARTGAEGILFFHTGSFESLVQKARSHFGI